MKHGDDKGVLRQYFEAKPNPMFTEAQRRSVLFVHYKESVSCTHCGRRGKHKWTSIVRFKVCDLGAFTLHPTLHPTRHWYAAFAPVCQKHIMHPDMAEFWREVRKARRAAKSDSRAATSRR